ncbi:MAG: guanylate kinase [Clostridia bacterium]|nr:guanylate kinase [Clostridia bacterium]
MKKLAVISGPAGVGKGTLVKLLTERNDDVALSVSCTTREPREGELDGVSYFFLTKEQFEEKIGQNGFLEYDNHFGNYYGTPKDFVFKTLETKNVILEIDVNGAMKVKKHFPDAVLIMILPPSIEELKKRLIGRKSETEASLKKRLERVDYELSFLPDYDEAVVNTDLEKAYEELVAILKK